VQAVAPIPLMFIFAMLAGVVFFVIQPLLRRNPDQVLEDLYIETPLDTLLHRKDAVYAAIKETEFDFKTNKLSDEDYAQLRGKLEAEAVELLGSIEAAEQGKKSRKGRAASKTKGASGKRSGVAYCGSCGAAIAKRNAKFCPSCGKSRSDSL